MSFLRATAALTPDTQYGFPKQSHPHGVPFTQQLPSVQPSYHQSLWDAQIQPHVLPGIRDTQATSSSHVHHASTEQSSLGHGLPTDVMSYLSASREQQALIAEAHMGYNPSLRNNSAYATPRDARPYTNPGALSYNQPTTQSNMHYAQPSLSSSTSYTGQQLASNQPYTAHQSVTNASANAQANRLRGGFLDVLNTPPHPNRVQLTIVNDTDSNPTTTIYHPSSTPIGHERQHLAAATATAATTITTDPTIHPSRTPSPSTPTLNDATMHLALTRVLTNLRSTRDAAFSLSRSDGFTRYRLPLPHETDLSPRGNRSFFDPVWNPPARIGRDPRRPQVEHEGRLTYFEELPGQGGKGGVGFGGGGWGGRGSRGF